MAKKQLSAKQKAVLAKGQSLMRAAVVLQKKAGVKTQHVKAGGKTQLLDVYKLNLSDALKKVKKQRLGL
jgi:hypothetical protein